MGQQIKISKIVRLKGEDAGIHNLYARFYNGHINKAFTRRQPVIIKNNRTGQKIIRYALGNNGISGLTSHSVAIDYDGIDTLGLSRQYEDLDISVRPATTLELYKCFWHHPDVPTRLSIRYSVLGMALGVLGFIQGLMGHF